jgi:hypothetical protein
VLPGGTGDANAVLLTSNRQTHGIGLLKRAVKTLGGRTIDRRTSLGKALAQWRSELIRDLGGEGGISTQERAIVDLAVKTKLMLDSVDAWLLTQPSLVNARKRALLPVVRERVQLSDALSRYLAQLGLKRRVKQVPDLAAYLAARGQSNKGGAKPLQAQHEGEDGPCQTDEPPSCAR